MYLQTKSNEDLIFSDEEKENYIYQDDQNLSCWNRYLLMYPHKCTLTILKEKYQEKWENAYLRVKNARASRALRQALDPDQYWFTSLAWLRFATSTKSQEQFLPPHDQILDPLLNLTLFHLEVSYLKCNRQLACAVSPHEPAPSQCRSFNFQRMNFVNFDEWLDIISSGG